MAIFYYKHIQLHLRKDQCIRLKHILSYSDEFCDFQELDCKLNDAIYEKERIDISIHEFRWIKNNMHLSRC